MTNHSNKIAYFSSACLLLLLLILLISPVLIKIVAVSVLIYGGFFYFLSGESGLPNKPFLSAVCFMAFAGVLSSASTYALIESVLSSSVIAELFSAHRDLHRINEVATRCAFIGCATGFLVSMILLSGSVLFLEKRSVAENQEIDF